MIEMLSILVTCVNVYTYRSFKIGVDSVVVGDSIVVQVVKSMDSNSIFTSRVTNSSIVAADLL